MASASESSSLPALPKPGDVAEHRTPAETKEKDKQPIEASQSDQSVGVGAQEHAPSTSDASKASRASGANAAPPASCKHATAQQSDASYGIKIRKICEIVDEMVNHPSAEKVKERGKLPLKDFTDTLHEGNSKLTTNEFMKNLRTNTPPVRIASCVDLKSDISPIYCYVVHTWQAPLLSLVKALTQFAENLQPTNPGDVCFWIDIFMIHDCGESYSSPADPSNKQSVFAYASSIQKARQMLVVVDEAGVIFSRAPCWLEVFQGSALCAKKARGGLDDSWSPFSDHHEAARERTTAGRGQTLLDKLVCDRSVEATPFLNFVFAPSERPQVVTQGTPSESTGSHGETSKTSGTDDIPPQQRPQEQQMQVRSGPLPLGANRLCFALDVNELESSDPDNKKRLSQEMSWGFPGAKYLETILFERLLPSYQADIERHCEHIVNASVPRSQLVPCYLRWSMLLHLGGFCYEAERMFELARRLSLSSDNPAPAAPLEEEVCVALALSALKSEKALYMWQVLELKAMASCGDVIAEDYHLPTVTQRVEILFNLGTVYFCQGKKDAAANSFSEVIAIQSKCLGEDRSAQSSPLTQLKDALANTTTLPTEVQEIILRSRLKQLAFKARIFLQRILPNEGANVVEDMQKLLEDKCNPFTKHPNAFILAVWMSHCRLLVAQKNWVQLNNVISVPNKLLDQLLKVSTEGADQNAFSLDMPWVGTFTSNFFMSRPHLVSSLCSMGSLNQQLGNISLAREQFMKALAIAAQIYGRKDRRVAFCQGLLASAHIDAGAYERALLLLDDALKIDLSSLDPDESVVHFRRMLRGKALLHQLLYGLVGDGAGWSSCWEDSEKALRCVCAMAEDRKCSDAGQALAHVPRHDNALDEDSVTREDEQILQEDVIVDSSRTVAAQALLYLAQLYNLRQGDSSKGIAKRMLDEAEKLLTKGLKKKPAQPTTSFKNDLLRCKLLLVRAEVEGDFTNAQNCLRFCQEALLPDHPVTLRAKLICLQLQTADPSIPRDGSLGTLDAVYLQLQKVLGFNHPILQNIQTPLSARNVSQLDPNRDLGSGTATEAMCEKRSYCIPTPHVVFVGNSGSGKTTLFRYLNNLLADTTSVRTADGNTADTNGMGDEASRPMDINKAELRRGCLLLNLDESQGSASAVPPASEQHLEHICARVVDCGGDDISQSFFPVVTKNTGRLVLIVINGSNPSDQVLHELQTWITFVRQDRIRLKEQEYVNELSQSVGRLFLVFTHVSSNEDDRQSLKEHVLDKLHKMPEEVRDLFGLTEKAHDLNRELDFVHFVNFSNFSMAPSDSSIYKSLVAVIRSRYQNMKEGAMVKSTSGERSGYRYSENDIRFFSAFADYLHKRPFHSECLGKIKEWAKRDQGVEPTALVKLLKLKDLKFFGCLPPFAEFTSTTNEDDAIIYLSMLVIDTAITICQLHPSWVHRRDYANTAGSHVLGMPQDEELKECDWDLDLARSCGKITQKLLEAIAKVNVEKSIERSGVHYNRPEDHEAEIKLAQKTLVGICKIRFCVLGNIGNVQFFLVPALFPSHDPFPIHWGRTSCSIFVSRPFAKSMFASIKLIRDFMGFVKETTEQSKNSALHQSEPLDLQLVSAWRRGCIFMLPGPKPCEIGMIVIPCQNVPVEKNVDGNLPPSPPDPRNLFEWAREDGDVVSNSTLTINKLYFMEHAFEHGIPRDCWERLNGQHGTIDLSDAFTVVFFCTQTAVVPVFFENIKKLVLGAPGSNWSKIWESSFGATGGPIELFGQPQTVHNLQAVGNHSTAATKSALQFLQSNIQDGQLSELHTHLHGMGSHEFWVDWVMGGLVPRSITLPLRLKSIGTTTLDALFGGLPSRNETAGSTSFTTLVCELLCLRDRIPPGSELQGLFDCLSNDDCVTTLRSPSADSQNLVCSFAEDHCSTLLKQFCTRLQDRKLLPFCPTDMKEDELIVELLEKFTADVVYPKNVLLAAFFGYNPESAEGRTIGDYETLDLLEKMLTNTHAKVRLSDEFREYIYFSVKEGQFVKATGIRNTYLVNIMELNVHPDSRSDIGFAIKAAIRNCFSMLNPDGSTARQADMFSYRGAFTPKFYPMRYALKDPLCEQIPAVTSYLLNTVIDRYRKAGVGYVEFSISYKDLKNKNMLAFLKPDSVFTQPGQDSPPSWFKLAPVVMCHEKPSNFHYYFLAAFNRTDTHYADLLWLLEQRGSGGEFKYADLNPNVFYPSLNVADTIPFHNGLSRFQRRFFVARNAPIYTSLLDALSPLSLLRNDAERKQKQCDCDRFLAMLFPKLFKKESDGKMPIDSILGFLEKLFLDEHCSDWKDPLCVGLDFVGDEDGFPFSPFCHSKFIEFFKKMTVHSKRLNERQPMNEKTRKEFRFGIRLHGGEGVQRGSCIHSDGGAAVESVKDSGFVPEEQDSREISVRSFYAHMNVIHQEIKTLTCLVAGWEDSPPIRIGHGIAFAAFASPQLGAVIYPPRSLQPIKFLMVKNKQTGAVDDVTRFAYQAAKSALDAARHLEEAAHLAREAVDCVQIAMEKFDTKCRKIPGIRRQSEIAEQLAREAALRSYRAATKHTGIVGAKVFFPAVHDTDFKVFRDFFRKMNICCEVNLTSNNILVNDAFSEADAKEFVSTSVLKRMLLVCKLPVTLSTDDDGIWPIHKCKHHYMHISVASEYCEAIALEGFSQEDVGKMIDWGKKSRFVR